MEDEPLIVRGKTVEDFRTVCGMNPAQNAGDGPGLAPVKQQFDSLIQCVDGYGSDHLILRSLFTMYRAVRVGDANRPSTRQTIVRAVPIKSADRDPAGAALSFPLLLSLGGLLAPLSSLQGAPAYGLSVVMARICRSRP